MSEAAQYSWPAVLGSLLRERELTRDAAAWAMQEIMSGAASDAQTAGFAVALSAAGESAEIVAGLVEVMLANAASAHAPNGCVDIVGTGGDQAATVNISTMSAIVASGAGVKVAKHGGRAASSKCGSADVLEALGVNLNLDGEGVARCIEQVGIGFFFAPNFHSGMRYAAPARRELGIPTVFNYLGPLSNPARPDAMAVGCADLRMAAVLADAMRLRGVSALVFRGDDGLDELTTTTTSRVWLVPPGAPEVIEHVLDPARLGIEPATAADLRGGDPEHNAQVVRDLLAGTAGPVREAVLLNTASAIVAHDGVPGNGEELELALAGAIARAADSIDSGRAQENLSRWIELSSS